MSIWEATRYFVRGPTAHCSGGGIRQIYFVVGILGS